VTSVPEDVRYTREHLWVRVEDGAARLGVTEHLADEMGRVVGLELPEAGQDLDATTQLAVIAGSSTGALDVFAPLTGTVSEVNEELAEDPDLLVTDCYDEGWICVLTDLDPDELTALLSPEEYEAFLAEAEE